MPNLTALWQHVLLNSSKAGGKFLLFLYKNEPPKRALSLITMINFDVSLSYPATTLTIGFYSHFIISLHKKL